MIGDRRRHRWKGRIRRLTGAAYRDGSVELYRDLCADNARASQLYRAGAFWAEINADFSDSIYAGALRNLRNQYFNRRFAGPNRAAGRSTSRFSGSTTSSSCRPTRTGS
jgi:hypothetical protein